MQPYEPSHDQNHRNLPSSRTGGTGSATPIYDALYAEYRQLFRALPGDRSGEEELRFEGFGTVHGFVTGRPAEPPRQLGHAAPAALPPAPRDGRRHDH